MPDATPSERAKAIWSFVSARPDGVEAAMAEVRFTSLAAPQSTLSRESRHRLVAALLETDAALVAPLDRMRNESVGYTSGRWASEFRSAEGKFRVFQYGGTLSFDGARRGVRRLVTGFDDQNFHPRVGAGSEDEIHRVFDLEAGWVGSMRSSSPLLVSVQSDEQLARIEALVQRHLAIATKHATVVLLDPIGEEEVDAFRTWAAQQLPRGGDVASTLTLERVSPPPRPDFLRLKVEAPLAVAERIAGELQVRFTERERGPEWVAAAVEKAQVLLSMGRPDASAALRWTRPILDIVPSHYEANLIEAVVRSDTAPLDALGVEDAQCFEARLARALVLLSRRDPEGLPALAEILRESPDDLDALVALGIRHYGRATKLVYGQGRPHTDVVDAEQAVLARRYLRHAVECGVTRSGARLRLTPQEKDLREAARWRLAKLGHASDEEA